ncbi:hypothetical protein [Burkholderia sp. JKS000303]|uniref:hypothetical protein n=1 Tax=Burkholderia sp. JKS000303 TaxID=1938747 RepID=UPI000C010B79|nr:hypothetical protein [Burkholderia sp. JKS000303]PFH28989.1 hypothetical protein BX604_2759 [Burkholderia sp. JKS000303]
MVDLSAHAYAAELKRFRATGSVWFDAHAHPAELEPVDCWAVMNAWFGIFVEEADKR